MDDNNRKYDKNRLLRSVANTLNEVHVLDDLLIEEFCSGESYDEDTPQQVVDAGEEVSRAFSQLRSKLRILAHAVKRGE